MKQPGSKPDPGSQPTPWEATGGGESEAENGVRYVYSRAWGISFRYPVYRIKKVGNWKICSLRNVVLVRMAVNKLMEGLRKVERSAQMVYRSLKWT